LDVLEKGILSDNFIDQIQLYHNASIQLVDGAEAAGPYLHIPFDYFLFWIKTISSDLFKRHFTHHLLEEGTKELVNLCI